MAEGKNKIIVYADWIEIFEPLSDDEAGKLVKHFFRYVNDLDPTSPDRLTTLLFDGSIKPTLKRDLKKWEEIAGKRSEAGKISAEKRKQQEPTKSTSVESVEQTPTKSTVKDKVIVKAKENNKVLFELFWNKYPNKTGKKPAKEKFDRLTDAEKETILKTIDSFAAYKPFETYSYPHATTYLNQRRWEDVIPSPEKKEHNITQDVWHIAKQIPAQKSKLCAQFNLTEEQFDNLYK